MKKDILKAIFAAIALFLFTVSQVGTQAAAGKLVMLALLSGALSTAVFLLVRPESVNSCINSRQSWSSAEKTFSTRTRLS